MLRYSNGEVWCHIELVAHGPAGSDGGPLMWPRWEEGPGAAISVPDTYYLVTHYSFSYLEIFPNIFCQNCFYDVSHDENSSLL